MNHPDYMGHSDGCGCAPCATWAEAAAGITKLMLQVRVLGIASVDGLAEKLCQDLCDHDRCGVIYSLERLYQQTKDEVEDAKALHDRWN